MSLTDAIAPPNAARAGPAPALRARRLGIDTLDETVLFLRRDCPVCRSEGFESRAMVRVRHGAREIVATGRAGRRRYGRVEAVPLETVPSRAVQVAVRAARLIGDGLYGVDVKEVRRRFLVMEVNDNPNVDAGCEDAVTGEKLYVAVMEWFRRRLDARGHEGAPLG